MKRSKPLARSEHRLEFACECVSAKGGYTDPWATIAQHKLLPDGTKEALLNRIADEPKTIAQLAKELRLSQPSIHAHINDMLASELVRESQRAAKQHPFERYYEPNFPVIGTAHRERFERVSRAVAERFAETFEQHIEALQEAYKGTDLAARGWAFRDVVQYCYARSQRNARELLESRDRLPRRATHGNGLAWLFWAQERSTDARAER